MRDPSWLIGQGVGLLGFLGQVAAVALAPLTLVQAFSAGSLAISVPIVARLFGHRVGRAQLTAVAIIALSLATLPIGLAHVHGHLQAGTLIGGLLAAILIAGVLAPAGGPLRLAVAAGLLYGAGDAAIKATALALRSHHPTGSVLGWAVLVVLYVPRLRLVPGGAAQGRCDPAAHADERVHGHRGSDLRHHRVR